VNGLIAFPIWLVAAGLLVPLVLLDAKKEYFAFLWSNPNLVVLVVGAWGVVFHWTTRRIAEVLLLRTSGAKLKVKDEA
jgi:hypothetical protein